ncbi:MAG: ABC transporter permease [Streptosporangiaceae bacterium]
MSAVTWVVRDSATMFRRDLRHSLRYPAMTVSGIIVPVLFLLLFDGVFGRTLHAGLAAVTPHAGSYIGYLAPGILLMTAASAAEATALNVVTDMAEGIITRLRTMAVTRAAVLTGQVLGSLLRTLISGAFVVAVAFGLGLRPTATALEWVAVAGVFAMVSIALTWVTVAFGLLARTPSGANSLALILVVLPFVSNAFVPADSMPAGVGWFAAHQPFTPMIDTLRGLLAGTPIGSSAVIAAAWCVALSLAGYLGARARYDQLPPRSA